MEPIRHRNGHRGCLGCLGRCCRLGWAPSAGGSVFGIGQDIFIGVVLVIIVAIWSVTAIRSSRRVVNNAWQWDYAAPGDDQSGPDAGHGGHRPGGHQQGGLHHRGGAGGGHGGHHGGGHHGGFGGGHGGHGGSGGDGGGGGGHHH